MGLQDEYLRRQIYEFRNQIDSILWFNSQYDGLEAWALANRIDMVHVDWSEFWEHWKIRVLESIKKTDP
jgi:hypothetical protein